MRAHPTALVNPNAGSFSPARLRSLREAGVRALLTPTLDALDEALRDLNATTDPALWAVGGDGTFVTVLSRLHARSAAPPPLGLIPWGSGNAVSSWLRAEGAPSVTHRSMIEVHGKLTPFVGIGLHGAMSHHVDAARRHWPTRNLAVSALWKLIPVFVSLPHASTRPAPRVRVVTRTPAHPVSARGEVGAQLPAGTCLWHGPALLVDASTCPSLGYGHRLFPHAERLQGHAQLRVLDMSALSWLRTFPDARRGRLRHPGAHSWLVKDVDIDVDAPSPLSIAGDADGMVQEVHMRVRQRVPLVAGYPSSTS